MKIAITGGHITPAFALLPKLRKKHTLLFLIRRHAYEGDAGLSYEYQTIRGGGIPYKTIVAGRLQRHFTWHTIPSLLRFPVGLFQSFFILWYFKPDVVLSFGGYVALPVCLAAFLLGIPIVTHEQTASNAGLANRIIGFLAKKVCVTFPETLGSFSKEKGVITGSPLREGLFRPAKKPPFALAKETLPILYVTGGSGGSHDINMLVEEILKKLLSKYIVVHQIGSVERFDDYERLAKTRKMLPPALKPRYIMRKHVDVPALAWLYTHATLLVGRSGANTVYEILTFGVPSLLIPLRIAASGEQEANARLVEKTGLGRLLAQDALTGGTLFLAIEEMVDDIERFRKHRELASKLVIRTAGEHIISIVEQIQTHA